MEQAILEAIKAYALADLAAERISGYLNGTRVKVNPYNLQITIVR